MTRAAANSAIVIGIAAIIGGALALRPVATRQPAPVTSTATVTAYEQLGVIPPPTKEAEKESDNGQAVDATGVSTPTRTGEVVRSPRRSARDDGAVQQSGSAGAAIHRRAEALVTAAATDDPYHDSMLPGGSKWATMSDEQPVNAPQTDASAMPTVTANRHAVSAGANSASSISAPTSDARSLSKAGPSPATESSVSGSNAPPQPPIPARPPVPGWTRCSTSWTQILTVGESGEQIWVFSTTLNDADVQDLATAVRWYDDITAKYPNVARNYAWLDCAGWRVRDYHQHGSSTPPADFYGARGLDSPLGTCHSTTPFRRAGAGRCSRKDESLGCSASGAMSTLGVLGGTLGDDGRVRGWVRWHSGWYVGTVEDTTCVDACAVGFDHPCDLSVETEEPAQRFGVVGQRFWSWWWGGDPNGEPPW